MIIGYAISQGIMHYSQAYNYIIKTKQNKYGVNIWPSLNNIMFGHHLRNPKYHPLLLVQQ